MKINRGFWFALGFLGLVYALAYLLPRIFFPANPGQVIQIFDRLIVAGIGIIVISFLLARFSLSGIRFSRFARTIRQEAGQVFEERYRVINPLPFSRLWWEISDRSQLPGNYGSRVISMIGPKETRVYTAYTQIFSRGAFPLGPTVISSGDPFGFFSISRSFPGSQVLLVYPLVVDLDRFAAPKGLFPGGRSVLQRTQEITPQAAGVREYIPGDGLRSIHWPSTVKRGHLMVKEFEQDPQADVWILVDAKANVHVKASHGKSRKISNLWQFWRKEESGPVLPRDTFEYAVSSAGSIAQYYLRDGRAVGMVSNGEPGTLLPPDRGERQLTKILENLAYLAGNGTQSLAELLEAVTPQIAQASTVVLITPVMDSAMEAAIDALLLRKLLPIIVFIERTSFMQEQTVGEVPIGLGFRPNIPLVRLTYGGDLKEMLET